MREIKFRTWDAENDEMLCDTGHYNSESPIMQYTTIRDVNGVEIYEGDIVKVKDYREYLSVVRFGVYDQDGSGGEYGPSKVIGFYLEALPNQIDEDGYAIPEEYEMTESVCGSSNKLVVISNIYENPELLYVGEGRRKDEA